MFQMCFVSDKIGMRFKIQCRCTSPRRGQPIRAGSGLRHNELPRQPHRHSSEEPSLRPRPCRPGSPTEHPIEVASRIARPAVSLCGPWLQTSCSRLTKNSAHTAGSAQLPNRILGQPAEHQTPEAWLRGPKRQHRALGPVG